MCFVLKLRRNSDGFEQARLSAYSSYSLFAGQPSNSRMITSKCTTFEQPAAPAISAEDAKMHLSARAEAKEERMAKRVVGICMIVAAVVAIIIICVLAFTPTQKPQAAQTNIVDQAKTAAVNKAIDASGVKGAVNDALLAHAGDISNATGISTTQVQNVIEKLDINDWEATTLPDGLTETATISGEAAGVPVTLTTYSDSSYASVTAYGQTIDLAVPSSAQQYLPLLAVIS